MDSRNRVIPALSLAIFVAFSVWITWRAKTLEHAGAGGFEAQKLVNKPAPDFALESFSGQRFQLSSFKGNRPVVVSFWASWCAPCRMEMPVLRKFYNANRSRDFEILAVSIDEDRTAAESFAREQNLPFPILLDSSQTAAKAYRVDGIPMLFVVNKNGIVEHYHQGLDPNIESVLNFELGISSPTVKATIP